jgi:hypothetical protein
MNALEQQLLQETIGGAEPRLMVCSQTRIDTGRWWRLTPVWLCVMADELLMLAVSRRRYVARLTLADCGDTHYCHTTGELVVEPGEDLVVSRFRVTPREALELLKMVGKEGEIK